MRNISNHELAALLILGDIKAERITAHPIVIQGGLSYQLTHFGASDSRSCKCCSGTAGSITVSGCNVEIHSRAYHTRRVMVFVLEPADVLDHMRPSQRELLGDALVSLEQHIRDEHPLARKG